MPCDAHQRGAVAAPNSQCELQQLADHTLKVTEARTNGRIGMVVLLVDRDDPNHIAMGSDVSKEAALLLLAEFALRLDAEVSG